jgi:glycosyltransferase involved in cell wall biosynthesis
MSTVDLSVIIPLYNEEDSIEPLHAAIVAGVEPIGLPYEIVYVDDGSKDATFAKAKQLAGRDHHVRVIKFRRNYGQTPAMAAGIDHAVGRILVTMDGDLQNDPSDIPAFIEKIDEGYDIVVGWRHRRQDKFVTRILPSIMANWLISKVTGVPIKDNGCSLKAYRADIIKKIPLYSEMHRFIPAMASLAGTKVAQLKVQHHARQFGESKYGLSRIYKVLLDLLYIRSVVFMYSRPILSFGTMAALIGLIGFMFIAFNGYLAFSQTGGGSLMFFGLGLLYCALAMFLGSLGLLGQLIYESGDSKTEAFAGLTAKVEIK